MNSKRIAWVAVVAACVISVAYIFVVGVDWGFTLRSGTVPSAIVTGLILSVWACVPYLILLPFARRGQSLHTAQGRLIALGNRQVAPTALMTIMTIMTISRRGTNGY